MTAPDPRVPRRIALPVDQATFDALERHLRGEPLPEAIALPDRIELSHALLKDGVAATLTLVRVNGRPRIDLTLLHRRSGGSVFLLAQRAGLPSLRGPIRLDTALGPFEVAIVASAPS